MVDEVQDKAIDLGLDGLYLPKMEIKVEPIDRAPSPPPSLPPPPPVEDGGRYNDEAAAAGSQSQSPHTCQVCGDIAAGFHCGAFVCEACKVSSF